MAELTLTEAARQLGRSKHFVDVLLRQGVIKSAQTPHRIDGDSVAEYLERLQQGYVRPMNDRISNRACRMIRRKVEQDQELTEVERATFLAALDRYEQDWNREYEKSNGIETSC